MKPSDDSQTLPDTSTTSPKMSYKRSSRTHAENLKLVAPIFKRFLRRQQQENAGRKIAEDQALRVSPVASDLIQ